MRDVFAVGSFERSISGRITSMVGFVYNFDDIYRTAVRAFVFPKFLVTISAEFCSIFPVELGIRFLLDAALVFHPRTEAMSSALMNGTSVLTDNHIELDISHLTVLNISKCHRTAIWKYMAIEMVCGVVMISTTKGFRYNVITL